MDKSMLGDLESLPEEDKVRMSTMIDQLQIRDRCTTGVESEMTEVESKMNIKTEDGGCKCNPCKCNPCNC